MTMELITEKSANRNIGDIRGYPPVATISITLSQKDLFNGSEPSSKEDETEVLKETNINSEVVVINFKR